MTLASQQFRLNRRVASADSCGNTMIAEAK